MSTFGVLGPLEVTREDGAVRLGGPKQRATLAILLLNANRIVPIERLADDLYAGAAPVTAVTQVHRQISELRKVLGDPSPIETRSPGYLIRVAGDDLDLRRFERAAEEGAKAFARGEAEDAARLLRQALELWRGPALADLAYEPFAQPAIARLEETRLAALEQRLDADLALGGHVDVIGELRALTAEHPLRERFRAQLMLALYRAGRQADALAVYRRTREEFAGSLGLEPSVALRALEQAILTHDPSLELPSVAGADAESARAVLATPVAIDRLDSLLALAAPLVQAPRAELIVACLVDDERQLPAAVSTLGSRRDLLPQSVRTAAFTTFDRPNDVARLVRNYDIELVLQDVPAELFAGGVPDDLAATLQRSPADVALLSGSALVWGRGGGVFVPFGGGPHDWAALELAARLASAGGVSLTLVGTTGDASRGRRDASRLLADAALSVQRVVGIDARPMLADLTAESLLAAAKSATAIVVGFSVRWRAEGLGPIRTAIVRDADAPVVLVHRGMRPGGLAPRESRTRFSWSLEP